MEYAPNLRYQAVADERTRQSHRDLNGIVRPANDAFWRAHTPPIAWNCRCNVVETTRKASDAAPQSPEALRSNFPHSYYDAQIFKPDHRTFEYAPKVPPEFVAQAQRAAQLAIARQRQYADLVKLQGHVAVAFEYGKGYATAHPEYHTKDFPENSAAAAILAKDDYIVQINKHVERDKFKNPELTVNGIISDLKKPEKEGRNGIKNGFASAKLQHINHVVINVFSGTSAQEIMYGLRNGFRFHEQIDVVLLIINNKSVMIAREDYEANRILKKLSDSGI